jgi:rubrerythrin
MTPTEALKIALEKEEASIKLYTDLPKQHSSLKDLYLFLINEEYKHKRLIKDKISEITRY